MTRKEISEFRDRLKEMLKRVDNERRLLKNEALQPVSAEAEGGVTNEPMDVGDLGSRTFSEEVTLGLLENEENLIEEINEALLRIDKQSFGTCVACQKPIAKARLEAIPYARHCLACALSVAGTTQ